MYRAATLNFNYISSINARYTYGCEYRVCRLYSMVFSSSLVVAAAAAAVAVLVVLLLLAFFFH